MADNLNRVDQYDIVHSTVRDERWSHGDVRYIEHIYMRCGIRIVTSDTRDPVNCFNCLTCARDWKYG